MYLYIFILFLPLILSFSLSPSRSLLLASCVLLVFSQWFQQSSSPQRATEIEKQTDRQTDRELTIAKSLVHRPNAAPATYGWAQGNTHDYISRPLEHVQTSPVLTTSTSHMYMYMGSQQVLQRIQCRLCMYVIAPERVYLSSIANRQSRRQQPISIVLVLTACQGVCHDTFIRVSSNHSKIFLNQYLLHSNSNHHHTSPNFIPCQHSCYVYATLPARLAVPNVETHVRF